MQLTVVWSKFYSRKNQRACLPHFFFFFCWCFSAPPSWLRPPIFGRSTLSSTVWSPKVNPKQWKTWPKMNALLISGVYPWQIQQMGSVSKHPLWPGGSSCSSTGATHKHKWDPDRDQMQQRPTGFQSGVNLLLYLRKHHFITKRISPSGENMECVPSVGWEWNKCLTKDGGWGVCAEQAG